MFTQQASETRAEGLRLRVSRLLNAQLSTLKIQNKIGNVDAICESSNIKVIFDFIINYCQVMLYLMFVESGANEVRAKREPSSFYERSE